MFLVVRDTVPAYPRDGGVPVWRDTVPAERETVEPEDLETVPAERDTVPVERDSVEPEVRDMFLVDDDAFLLTEVSLELLLLDTDEEVLLDTDEPDTALLGTVDVREPYERVEFRDPK